jgi:hypothetical protein
MGPCLSAALAPTDRFYGIRRHAVPLLPRLPGGKGSLVPIERRGLELQHAGVAAGAAAGVDVQWRRRLRHRVGGSRGGVAAGHRSVTVVALAR